MIAPVYSHEEPSHSYVFKTDSDTKAELGFKGFQSLQKQSDECFYKENSLFRIKNVNWVRKTITQIKEGNFGYFLT